jgi:hypothetical protein
LAVSKPCLSHPPTPTPTTKISRKIIFWPLKYKGGDPYPFLRTLEQRIQLGNKMYEERIAKMDKVIDGWKFHQAALDSTEHMGWEKPRER